MTAKRHAFGFYLLLGGFVFLPLLGLVLAVFTPTPLFEAPELSYAALGSLLLKTFFLAFTVTALALPIGTWLAMVTTRFNVSGRRFLSILTLAPLALPSYVLAAILRESLAPRGVLGKIVGVWIGGALAGTDRVTRKWMGVAMLPQAGVAFMHHQIHPKRRRRFASLLCVSIEIRADFGQPLIQAFA